MKIDVSQMQRAFVVRDGKAVKYLTPGRHTVLAPFEQVKVEFVSMASLTAELDESRLALVPADDLQVVSLAEHERAVVYRRGRAVLWLGSGVHQVWTVERSVDRKSGAVTPLVRVEVFDTSAVQAKVLPVEVAALAKGRDYVEVMAPEGTVVTRFVDGRLDAVLPAGRHAGWNTMHTVQLAVIDLRERVLNVSGQEVMTRDRVSLRLNIAATVRVKDAARLATVAKAPDELVYLSMQLVAREAVTARTLDELLAMREELPKVMTPVVRERAEALGLELVELGLKDIVLPGDMRDLLNKVISAQKQAEANVIMRREETAATRSLAQTAKVLQENPLLIRLKELEAWGELAGKVGKLNVVMGDNALPSLTK